MRWGNKEASHGQDLYQSGTYFRPRKFEDFWNKDSNEGDGYFEFEVDYDKLALGYPALDARRDENNHPDLSIFLTCRQISAEAMDMYYAENTFIFCLINFGVSECSMTSANAAWSFLMDRPKEMLSRIRHIDLYIYGWDQYDGFQILDAQVWKNLMGILKSNMKLQHLSLHLRGRLADLRDGDVNGDSTMVSDEEVSNKNPRLNELTQLPKLNRLTIYFSGFREPQDSVDRHKHRRACFTARRHNVCHNADSALQFAALARFLRSSLLWNGQLLGSTNIRAQLMRDPELVANDIDSQALDTRHGSKCNYFLSMQTDDHGVCNGLLPQKHPQPVRDENGTHQTQRAIDIFEPLGGSASLDRIKTRGRRYD